MAVIPQGKRENLEAVGGRILRVEVTLQLCSFHYFLLLLQNNIAMALEVTYRERLHRVYREVKSRLDYHISAQNMMRRKEQEHMINWVEKHVVQSISAQQVPGS